MATSLKLFLKENKKEKGIAEYAATKSLCDEKGEPLKWKIRSVPTKEYEDIREACTREVQVTGKPGVYRQKFESSKFLARLICASVVEPDLYDKDLQDSYGVMTPEELIQQMVDDAGEYSEFANFVQDYNGFDETMQEKVDEAKN